METAFIVKDSIYCRQTVFYTGHSKEDFYFLIEKELGVVDFSDAIDDYFEKDSTAYARTIFRNNVVFILIKDNYLMPDILAHECFHAVEYHFGRIGLPHSETSSEAWAYYLAFLVRRFNEEMDSQKKLKESLLEHKTEFDSKIVYSSCKQTVESMPIEFATPYKEREDVGMDKIAYSSVKVEFFKDNGKYYSGFDFETKLPVTDIDEIREEIRSHEYFIPDLTYTIEVRSYFNNAWNKYLRIQ